MKDKNRKDRSTSDDLLNSRGNRRTNKNSRKAKKRKKRIILFAIEGFLLLLVLAFVFIFNTLHKINREPIDPTDISSNSLEPEVIKYMEKYTNIALFGVDARDNKSLGKGTHADVNMICSINNNTKEIKLVSVYRDTYLNINGDAEFNKLTQAYFSGGASQSISTLNKNMDLNITKYVTVNWKAVADAINILGGIDLEISKAEFSYINGFITETVKSTGVGSTHIKSAGMNHLDGVQAVAYARLRLMDTDYKRTERQRKVIGLAMEKAKKADLKTLYNLVDTVLPQISTNLTDVEILAMATDVAKYNIGDTAGFPFDKDDKTMGKKGSCVIPLGLEQNVYQLHTFLFGNEPYSASATVTKIDKMIIDASGWGAPGTTVKSTASNSSNSATTAAPTTAKITVEDSTKAEETNTVDVTELPTNTSESAAPSEGDQSTEGTAEIPTSAVPADAAVDNPTLAVIEYISD